MSKNKKVEDWIVNRIDLMHASHGFREDGSPRNYWHKVSADGTRLMVQNVVGPADPNGEIFVRYLDDTGWLRVSEEPEWAINQPWWHLQDWREYSDFDDQESIEDAVAYANS